MDFTSKQNVGTFTFALSDGNRGTIQVYNPVLNPFTIKGATFHGGIGALKSPNNTTEIYIDQMQNMTITVVSGTEIVGIVVAKLPPGTPPFQRDTIFNWVRTFRSTKQQYSQ